MTASWLATATQMRATEPNIPPQDFLSQEESSNGTHKDKGEEAGPRTHGEEEWSRR